MNFLPVGSGTFRMKCNNINVFLRGNIIGKRSVMAIIHGQIL